MNKEFFRLFTSSKQVFFINSHFKKRSVIFGAFAIYNHVKQIKTEPTNHGDTYSIIFNSCNIN